MTATFVRVPAAGDVPYPVMMEPNLVIEFYSSCRSRSAGAGKGPSAQSVHQRRRHRRG
jgi:hypothetical protein